MRGGGTRALCIMHQGNGNWMALNYKNPIRSHAKSNRSIGTRVLCDDSLSQLVSQHQSFFDCVELFPIARFVWVCVLIV